jgi:hypothetical protein
MESLPWTCSWNVPKDEYLRRARSESARRPVSRVLSPGRPRGWPFIWDARRRAPRATYPDGGAETRGPEGVPSLFGLAPGGVCRAVGVTVDAVRSYRTLSPLPQGPKAQGRFAFCGTFPGVAPAGRYPAPCFRGARTFLPPTAFAIAEERPSGRLARPIGRVRRLRGQSSRSTSAASRPMVSASGTPSTRAGRKWRWKAVTTAAVLSSSARVRGTS